MDMDMPPLGAVTRLVERHHHSDFPLDENLSIGLAGSSAACTRQPDRALRSSVAVAVAERCRHHFHLPLRTWWQLIHPLGISFEIYFTGLITPRVAGH